MRTSREWLGDMLEAIENIERYAEQGFDALAGNELVRTWMIHQLQVIGEAAARLGKSFHNEHPELSWPDIVALRNMLVHEYFGIDLDEIWATIEHDIPVLKHQLLLWYDDLNQTQP